MINSTNDRSSKVAQTILAIYCVYLALPLYWLLAISVQQNADITGAFSIFPREPSLKNFMELWMNPVWSRSFINSLTYVVINTLLSISLALPAAYAFSRYQLLGDRQLFFWLLTNRMAPPAVFLLPFFQLYSAFGLFDTPLAVGLAHCLFTVPMAVWILEGFMSSIPKELDEMAKIDGHSFGFFFLRIFDASIYASSTIFLISSSIILAVESDRFFCWETDLPRNTSCSSAL